MIAKARISKSAYKECLNPSSQELGYNLEQLSDQPISCGSFSQLHTHVLVFSYTAIFIHALESCKYVQYLITYFFSVLEFKVYCCLGFFIHNWNPTGSESFKVFFYYCYFSSLYFLSPSLSSFFSSYPIYHQHQLQLHHHHHHQLLRFGANCSNLVIPPCPAL